MPKKGGVGGRGPKAAKAAKDAAAAAAAAVAGGTAAASTSTSAAVTSGKGGASASSAAAAPGFQEKTFSDDKSGGAAGVSGAAAAAAAVSGAGAGGHHAHNKTKANDKPYDPTDLSKPIPTGNHIYCKWRDDLFHECTVLDSKKIDPKTQTAVNAALAAQAAAMNTSAAMNDTSGAAAAAAAAASSAVAASTAQLTGSASVITNPVSVPGYPPIYYVHRIDASHPFVYYVHYTEFNRRMDEWMPRERISFTAPAVAAHSAASLAAAAAAASAAAAAAASGPGKGKSLGDTEDATGRRRGGRLAGKDGGKSGGKKGGKKSAVPSGGNHHGGGNDHSGGHGGAGYDAASLHAHEEFTKVKNVNHIVLGKYEMETWYYSPFPEEYNPFSTLYFCEFCLKFFGYDSELKRHSRRCQLRHPPGNEIYRSEETNVTIAMFEVDGAKEIIYAQNICYIAKLFLDHKTLQFDTTPFLFYVLCEVDTRGCHVVGYFSKEKLSEEKYNLACILTLPCHQRKGYGKFLISFSYELSKIEEKIGSPEKPLSDLGLVSYRSYWACVLLEILAAQIERTSLSIEDLSRMTCITASDIIDTLQFVKVIKYHRGEHMIVLNEAIINEHKPKPIINKPGVIFVRPCLPEKLHWTPFILSIKRQRTQL